MHRKTHLLEKTVEIHVDGVSSGAIKQDVFAMPVTETEVSLNLATGDGSLTRAHDLS